MHNQQDFDMRIWKLAQGERDAPLEQHIATCEACQEVLETMRPLAQLRQVAGGAMVEPSVALTSRLNSLFGAVRPDLVARQVSPVTRALAGLRRITAELVLDSGAQPQLVGLRSGTDRRTRQLVFVSDVGDLDLEVTVGADALSVAGQIGMDAVPDGLRIRFTPAALDPLGDDVTGSVEADIAADGHFQLGLVAGEWVASVVLDDAVLVFPGVRL